MDYKSCHTHPSGKLLQLDYDQKTPYAKPVVIPTQAVDFYNCRMSVS